MDRSAFQTGTHRETDPRAFRRQLLVEVVDATKEARRRTMNQQEYVEYTSLPLSTRYSPDLVLDQLDILESEGRVKLVRNLDLCAVKPTAAGLLSLEADESEWQQRSQPLMQTNHLTVNHSNIGILSQTGEVRESHVNQTVGSDLIEVFRLIDGVVGAVKAAPVSSGVKDDADVEASQLKQELKRSAPRADRIKAALSWFSTLNGAVGFGEHLPKLIHELGHLVQGLHF